jgi:hypothetical protein
MQRRRDGQREGEGRREKRRRGRGEEDDILG